MFRQSRTRRSESVWGQLIIMCLFPAGASVPSFGDAYLGGVGRESRAQTLARGEWPAGGATGLKTDSRFTSSCFTMFVCFLYTGVKLMWWKSVLLVEFWPWMWTDQFVCTLVQLTHESDTTEVSGAPFILNPEDLQRSRRISSLFTHAAHSTKGYWR